MTSAEKAAAILYGSTTALLIVVLICVVIGILLYKVGYRLLKTLRHKLSKGKRKELSGEVAKLIWGVTVAVFIVSVSILILQSFVNQALIARGEQPTRFLWLLLVAILPYIAYWTVQIIIDIRIGKKAP